VVAVADVEATRIPRLIREARDRFHDCTEAEDPQRKSTLEAKRFLALDQWPEDIKIQRQGGIAEQGQPAQPPRPCLTLDCVSEPHQSVVNAIKQADFAVKVTSKVKPGDDTEEILEGLIRQIQNESRADDPVGWAADNAAGSGFGWFGVKSEYESEDAFDQYLCLTRIENCLSVYCDPAAVSPTRRDARFMFVTEDVPKQEYERRWPKADVKSLEDFRSTGDDKDAWVTDKAIRIANYWWIEQQADELFELIDGSVVRLSELDGEKPDKTIIVHARKVFKQIVHCDTISATEVLEAYLWGGTTIPLIPIFGQHMNVDGKKIEFGVTQRAIGPQQMVNFTYSATAETVALAPKAPFIVAEGQIEGYEDQWQNANRWNYSYLPYKPTDLMGTPNPPPQRNNAEPPVQAMSMVMQMSLDAVRRTTSFDPGLGQMPGRQMSADAIEALQNQGERSHSGYLDNVRRAYLRLGEILLEAIPVYYDRPGRIIQILGLEDEPDQVMINQPHMKGPDGQPQPLDVPKGQPLPEGAKHFDLKHKAKYGVMADIGRSFTTRRKEGVAALAEFAKVAPELVPKYADLWVGEMDFPGAQAVKERLQPPGAADSPLPPEVQAQMAAMGQENQQLKMMIATKQPELDSRERIASEKNLVDLKKAEISAAATMTTAQWKVDAENARSFVQAFEAKLAHDEGFRLEVARQTIQHMATMGEKGADHAHDAASQARDHAHEADLAAKAAQTAALTASDSEA
jgi:hypothetical protein